MTDTRIRVAVVGVGGWGPVHARAFSNRSDAELCAVVDCDPGTADARGREFRVPCYLDIDEMLRTERPDLVSLAVTNTRQVEPTLALIRAGVPLLVEKPLAFALADADMLLAEAAERRLFFAINFNYRYARPVRLAYEAIQQGRIGEPIFAAWRFEGSKSPTDHPHANLIETQCHGFDMLEHCCGPIESLMAEMTDVTQGGFTTLVVSLKFASGAVGCIIGSYDSSYEYANTQVLEVNGTTGRVIVEDTVRRFTFQEKGSEMRQVWETGYFNDSDRTIRKLIDVHLDELLAAFRAGREPPVHARAGRRALALAEAAIASCRTGRRVLVDRADGPIMPVGLQGRPPSHGTIVEARL
ncbi:Gfo/Idh/MocA family protein [Microvirga calopogonii]|uniref:Gfo/Idh/MocA family protein n=1 Tax=Microvirga calopogonii TaxID=2078013 RepID=UPI000E0CF295|nr:Gfo/Idh/MocA family oxidoreductase [Microvirga calopogonii]